MLAIVFWFLVIVGFVMLASATIRGIRAAHRRQLQASAEQAAENARNAAYRRDVERMLDPAKASDWTSHPGRRDPA